MRGRDHDVELLLVKVGADLTRTDIERRLFTLLLEAPEHANDVGTTEQQRYSQIAEPSEVELWVQRAGGWGARLLGLRALAGCSSYVFERSNW